MTHSRTEYAAVIRSPPDTVDDAHDFLEQVWVRRPDVSATERMVMETALSELVTNVIQNNPHRPVLCEVTVIIEPDTLVLETADTGQELSQPPPTPVMPDEHAEHGRGLALIELIVDQLSYHHDGSRNIWRAVKSRTAGVGKAP